MARSLEPKVFLVGRVALESDGRVVDEAQFPGRQGRLTFAYLVAEGGRAVPRDELAEALWGEAPPSTWDKALTGIVSKLRTLLAEHGIDGANALTGAFGCYRLDLPEGSWVDVLAAGCAADEAEAALAAGELDGAKDAAALAASLLRQQFLPGEEGSWVEQKRRELAEVRGRAFSALAEASLRSGDASEAVKWAEQTIVLAPFRESGYRRLMEAHVAAGDRAEALRVYERCRQLLADELGTYPSPETEAIYRTLLQPPEVEGRAAPAFEPAPEARAPTDREPSRPRAHRVGVALAGALVAATAVGAAVVLHARGGPGSAVAGVSSDSLGIFAAGTGRPRGQVPVGASPSSVAAGDGSIWVANVDANTVSRIDPAKQVVIQTFEVGNGPAGIAFGGRFVWVTNALDGTVSQIDPQTNTVVNPAIPVGNRPFGIAAGRRFVWVANSGDSSVSRISLATGKVVPRTIAVDGGATGIAVGDGSVWVTGQATGTVTRIDEGSGTVLGPVHAGSGATAVAVGEGAVWVANTLDGTVTRIDPETNAVASTIPVGDGPSGIAVAPGSVWVSNAFAGTLSRIDPRRNVSVQTVTTGNRPQGVVVEPNGLFVAVRASGTGHRGGTLRVLGASGYLGNIDPSLAYLGDEVGVATLTNDGLVGYLKTGGTAGIGLVPDLAVSLPSPTNGGRTYSFQLRPGIRYSTGGVVRPADVRASLERSLEAGGGYDPYFAHIVGASRCLAAPKKPCDLSRGIETDAGSNTVTFHLTSPDPDFLHELTLPPAFVVPVGTPLHGHGFAPATGPYEVASWSPKTGVRLVRNPKFREWSPAAQPGGLPDVIEERLGGSMDARVAKVLQGDADLALDDDEAPSQAVVASIRTQHAALLKVSPSDGTWYLALNTRVAPFDNLDARKGLNLAIDRKRLSDLAFGPDVSHVTCQTLPPDFPGYRRYCPYPAAPDLARARELVHLSGTAGQRVTVWGQRQFRIPNAARRYIVSVLDRLGYKARFRTYPGERFSGGQMAYNGWYADYAAPEGFLLAVLTCGAYKTDPAQNFNASGFCDPAIDREIARADALQTTDLEASSRLWAKVDRDLTDQAPWAAFANNSVVEVKSPRVGNYQVNPQLGTLLDQLWVK